MAWEFGKYANTLRYNAMKKIKVNFSRKQKNDLSLNNDTILRIRADSHHTASPGPITVQSI